MNFLFVGMGGALGSMMRYAISLILWKGQFPVLTLCTNVIGAIMIGFVTGLAAQKNISQSWMMFLKTGLCGGFTTFSTFSLESFILMENGRHGLSVLYMISSVLLCLMGIWLGMAVSRKCCG
ncbi:MAG: fluoride efflux transporter CrcB [Eubacteriales bacterium]|nr:fluoride efflux transporter CrcB [Eubacteriales bacterium]